jgi:hypothetical protein
MGGSGGEDVKLAVVLGDGGVVGSGVLAAELEGLLSVSGEGEGEESEGELCGGAGHGGS